MRLDCFSGSLQPLEPDFLDGIQLWMQFSSLKGLGDLVSAVPQEGEPAWEGCGLFRR